mgnify:CR=1 FL=1
MIGGDRVTDVQEAVGAIDAVDGGGAGLGRLEEGWVVDVGGVVIPVVELASGGLEVLPHLAAVEDVVISRLEHLGGNDAVSNGGDLITGWPDVSEEDVASRLILANWLCLEVEVHSAGEGVGNDERWGGQIVGTSVRMDTALEVSVSGEILNELSEP